MKGMRISATSNLARCPGFAMLRLRDGRAGSSMKADTGSAAGRLIELWHRGSLWEDACRQAERELPENFAAADMEEARRLARAYTEDERNGGGVVLGELCEQEVKLSLPPAPEDPTQEPVELVGHVDQIRRVNGRLEVWDVKCGSPSGIDLLYGYAWQLAAYALAATATLGEHVAPGGIIRPRGYFARSKPPRNEAPVFFHAPWSHEQCEEMLATVAQHVAWIRSGLVHLHPGTHCSWCPAGGPHLCGELIAREFSS